jgi:hypothetical protein
MPGPIPKDPWQRRRRNAPIANTKRLPAEGRTGPIPDWPLGSQSEAERAAWAEVWSTPQAIEWERMTWLHPIARYLRILIASEERGAKAALLAEVRNLEQQLGLTPMALLRLRWEIEPGEPATVTPIAEAPKRRLIVDGDNGDG